MIALCPACAQRYDFPPVWLKGQDGMARCAKCGCRFPVHRPVRPSAGAPSALPRSAPAGGPAISPVPASAAGAPAADLPPADATGLTRVGQSARPPADAAPAPHVRIALTALGGALTDGTFLIARSPTVIGRAEGDIRVPDPKASGRHAQVELTGGEAWLRDLGSTNGTFVNGARVELVRLKHMDEVAVGGTRLLYTYIEDFVTMYEALSPGA
jgi:hypothetical protein